MPSTCPDAARRSLGFLGAQDTAALSTRGIVVLDAGSTLVSEEAEIEPGVTLWPGVILQVRDGGRLSVAGDTILHPGVRIVAAAGTVLIGRQAEIGEEGGFTLKADGAPRSRSEPARAFSAAAR